MQIHQISVFLENRAGQLAEITQLLADSGVDIRAISIAETADYGVARMIVDDCNKASAILLEHGDILSLTPVCVVQVPDQPTGLSQLLAVLAQAGIDVQYMYSLTTHPDGYAYMVLRVADETLMQQALAAKGISLLNKAQLGLK